MILNIKLLNGLSDTYNNKLVGLMGNINGNTADDIMSRNKAMPANISLESSIYPIAMNCTLNFKTFCLNNKFIKLFKGLFLRRKNYYLPKTFQYLIEILFHQLIHQHSQII